MIEKIDEAIKRLANSVDDKVDATDALKVTQAVLNLANAKAVLSLAKACLTQTRLNEEAAD